MYFKESEWAIDPIIPYPIIIEKSTVSVDRGNIALKKELAKIKLSSCE